MPILRSVSLRQGAVQTGGGGPDGTDFYVELTIQSSQVASTLTSFPVYVSLAGMPAGFWSNVQSDGGDIRVTESDGTTRVPVELVDIDSVANTGELHFLASSLSASTNTTYRIYYGSSSTLSQPAVTDTYGRNAVWSGYTAVWHMQEDPSGTAPQMVDSTGNGLNLTSEGSMTSADLVTAKLGSGVEFDGVNDRLRHSDNALLDVGTNVDFSIQMWFKHPATGVSRGLLSKYNSVTDGGRLLFLSADGTLNFDGRSRTGSYQTLDSAVAGLDDDAWHLAYAMRSGTNWILDVDGSESSAAHGSGDMSNGNDFWLATLQTDANPPASFLDGILDEVRLIDVALSGAQRDAEFTNQNTPGTFYTVGAQQAA